MLQGLSSHSRLSNFVWLDLWDISLLWECFHAVVFYSSKSLKIRSTMMREFRESKATESITRRRRRLAACRSRWWCCWRLKIGSLIKININYEAPCWSGIVTVGWLPLSLLSAVGGTRWDAVGRGGEAACHANNYPLKFQHPFEKIASLWSGRRGRAEWPVAHFNKFDKVKGTIVNQDGERWVMLSRRTKGCTYGARMALAPRRADVCWSISFVIWADHNYSQQWYAALLGVGPIVTFAAVTMNATVSHWLVLNGVLLIMPCDLRLPLYDFWSFAFSAGEQFVQLLFLVWLERIDQLMDCRPTCLWNGLGIS